MIPNLDLTKLKKKEMTETRKAEIWGVVNNKWEQSTLSKTIEENWDEVVRWTPCNTDGEEFGDYDFFLVQDNGGGRALYRRKRGDT